MSAGSAVVQRPHWLDVEAACSQAGRWCRLWPWARAWVPVPGLSMCPGLLTAQLVLGRSVPRVSFPKTQSEAVSLLRIQSERSQAHFLFSLRVWWTPEGNLAQGGQAPHLLVGRPTCVTLRRPTYFDFMHIFSVSYDAPALTT